MSQQSDSPTGLKPLASPDLRSPDLRSPDSVGSFPAAPKQSKGLACIFCQQRKVKCDRQNPCNTCTKSRVQCVYRTRRAPRRKDARATEVSLRARLGRLEDLLKTAVARNELLEGDGVEQDEQESPSAATDDKSNDLIASRFVHSLTLSEWMNGAQQDLPDRPKPNPKTHPFGSPHGRMFTEPGKSRYIESKLWSKIYDEVKDAQEVLDEDDESESESSEEEFLGDSRHDALADDLIFGLHDGKTDLFALFPTPTNMATLWLAFTENVNPLNKIVHVPSTQPMVSEAMTNPQLVSKPDLAFLFATWFGGVSSLTDEDCKMLLGESRPVLLKRYKIGTQKALLNANYLRSSNLNCLRAFVIYLLGIRPYVDSKTFWATVGMAVRMAQRLGIHKDGALFNLPPFETEMRRRLWWQIIHIDVRASEVAGAGIMTVTIGDIKRPLNINDEDMSPDMQTTPVEHDGPTEMCFVLLRCSIGRYFRYLFRPIGQPMQADMEFEYAHPEKPMEELMDEFESFVLEKFTRNADPLVPIQFFTSMVARAIMCSWKVLNALRKTAEDKSRMLQEDRDMLFEEALKGIEYDNLGHTTKSTQRFMWHIASHFQWHSLISLLHELRVRPSGDLVERAWYQVAETYKNRPELMKTRNPLHAAIGRLTMAAWRVREDNYTRVHKAPIFVPAYITSIQQQLLLRGNARDRSATGSIVSGDIGSMSEWTNLASNSSRVRSPVSVREGTPTFKVNSFAQTGKPDTSISYGPETVTALPTNMDFSNQDWFNSPLDPNPENMLNAGQMDWSMWGSLLQDYELPIDGMDFAVPTAPPTTFGSGFNVG